MNGPRIVCAGCGHETTLAKPVCDACLAASGIGPVAACALCEATIMLVNPTVLPAERGLHMTKDGGYAGKCTAILRSQLSEETEHG